MRPGTARLPRRFAPRNDTSGEREVHQCPPAVELLPTGRSLSAATGPVGAVTILTAACANRLCSAGRGMPLPYNGGYHETAAGTGRQCLPEIATAPLGPRNDKLGGLFHFNGGLYGLRVPRRARHASPLQRTTGSPAALSTLHFPRKKSRTCVREFFSQSSIQILKLPISPSGSPLRPSGPRRAAPCPSGSASPATGSSR